MKKILGLRTTFVQVSLPTGRQAPNFSLSKNKIMEWSTFTSYIALPQYDACSSIPPIFSLSEKIGGAEEI